MLHTRTATSSSVKIKSAQQREKQISLMRLLWSLLLANLKIFLHVIQLPIRSIIFCVSAALQEIFLLNKFRLIMCGWDEAWKASLRGFWKQNRKGHLEIFFKKYFKSFHSENFFKQFKKIKRFEQFFAVFCAEIWTKKLIPLREQFKFPHLSILILFGYKKKYF